MHHDSGKGKKPAAEIVQAFLAPVKLMKFTLTYDGELKATGNHSRRVREKWQIRKSLVPQLIKLWNTHPALMGLAIVLPQPLHMYPVARPTEIVSDYGLKQELSRPVTIGDKEFLPLVRASLRLACSLNINFLRQDEPGALIIPGGDIDNRLKTLFDALSIPEAQDVAEAGEELMQPFPCLLEKDSLITGVNVTTDRLLTKPDASPSEVRLTIQVEVSIMQITASNIGFIGN